MDFAAQIVVHLHIQQIMVLSETVRGQAGLNPDRRGIVREMILGQIVPLHVAVAKKSLIVSIKIIVLSSIKKRKYHVKGLLRTSLVAWKYVATRRCATIVLQHAGCVARIVKPINSKRTIRN